MAGARDSWDRGSQNDLLPSHLNISNGGGGNGNGTNNVSDFSVSEVCDGSPSSFEYYETELNNGLSNLNLGAKAKKVCWFLNNHFVA